MLGHALDLKGQESSCHFLPGNSHHGRNQTSLRPGCYQHVHVNYRKSSWGEKCLGSSWLSQPSLLKPEIIRSKQVINHLQTMGLMFSVSHNQQNQQYRSRRTTSLSPNQAIEWWEMKCSFFFFNGTTFLDRLLDISKGLKKCPRNHCITAADHRGKHALC